MQTTSPSEHWHQVQVLFDQVLDLEPHLRAEHLEHACAGDSRLLREVLSLLSAHENAGDFLETRGRRDRAALAAIIPSLRAQPGEIIGTYQIVRELGSGGMGEVYLARDTRLERPVALKFLPPLLSAHEEAKARLIAEARAAAVLDHPNVATVYEISEAGGGRLFIAMAYCEGETLKQRIGRGPLTIDEALGITLQIASGLQAAHRKGVIHRDVKPANVLIPLVGPLKIVDFGIAKRTGQDLTRTGQTMGTFAYMSPEQVRSEAVDHRTDLWSLGVVLYEMLAGRQPFRADYDAGILHDILYTEPPAVTGIRPEVPPALSAVVTKLLAKDREERYTDVEELLADLERARRAPGDQQGTGVHTPRPARLPAPPTELVGRQEELGRIERLVRSDRVRLLTLTGPGGTGKTRLAIRAAADLAPRFDDCVYFVSLAPITDPALVATTAARVLGVRELGSTPMREALVGFLSDKRALVVFDNFEQVIEAADLVADLLAGCPGLTILVTSRTPLRIQGEQEFFVPPLALPRPLDFASAERLSRYESIALFTARAQAVRPGFSLLAENASAVAEICVRLDGLPLAIELAAARVKVLSPKAILSRLQNRFDLLADGARDRPARHRTLREAISWSFDLLCPSDKTLFQSLSVFAGGFTLEAAEAVAAALEAEGIDVLSGLSSLVDQSLLRQEEQPDGEPRFFMLETIREFALEKLQANGCEAAVRGAHLAFIVDLARSVARQIIGPHQGEVGDRLEREHNNIRAALQYAAAEHLPAAAEIIATLWRYYYMRGYAAEGYEAAARVLKSSGSDLNPILRARMLMGAAMLAHTTGLIRTARVKLEEALTLLQGDEELTAEAMGHLGWILIAQGEHARGQALSEEALAIHRRRGNDRGIGVALNNLGFIALERGDFAQAGAYLEESVAFYTAIGDLRGYGRALTNLSWARHLQGRHAEAVALNEEAIGLSEGVRDPYGRAFVRQRLAWSRYEMGEPLSSVMAVVDENLGRFREWGHSAGIMECLDILSNVLLSSGDTERLETICQEYLARATNTGYKPGAARVTLRMGFVRHRQGDLNAAAEYYRESLLMRREMEEQAGVARCLEGLASLAYEKGQSEKAAILIGSAEAIRHRVDAPIQPRTLDEYHALLQDLLDALGNGAFEQSREAGRRLSYAEAIELGLEPL